MHSVNYMSIILVMACLLCATVNPSTLPFCKDTSWNNYYMVKHTYFSTGYYANWYSVFTHSLTSFTTILFYEINSPFIESQFWFRFCKRTPLAYILCHMNKINIIPFMFHTNFNIILPSTNSSTQWFRSFKGLLSHYNLLRTCSSSHACFCFNHFMFLYMAAVLLVTMKKEHTRLLYPSLGTKSI